MEYPWWRVTANWPDPGSAHNFFFLAIAGSQWRQAQILSPWLVGASGHGDLLREPLRPPYRRHFRLPLPDMDWFIFLIRCLLYLLPFTFSED